MKYPYNSPVTQILSSSTIGINCSSLVNYVAEGTGYTETSGTSQKGGDAHERYAQTAMWEDFDEEELDDEEEDSLHTWGW